MKIIFASKNVGKIREVEALLAGAGVELCSLKDYPNIPEIVEDGQTFFENAYKKARIVAEATGEITIADDSGLVVDFLDGAPGVYSARYAGESASDEENIEKLLMALSGIPDEQRVARFVCCLVLYKNEDDTNFFEGKLEGIIHHEMVGSDGFGYDPIFYMPKMKCTVAQLPLDEKNKISHRANAFVALKSYLASVGA